MSEYADKLASIVSQKQKLIEKEQILVQKRKTEIGELAEKLGLLTAPDVLLAGLFHTANQALQGNPQQLKEWESIGTNYLKPKSTNRSRPSKNPMAESTA